jgi:hypothetical protein
LLLNGFGGWLSTHQISGLFVVVVQIVTLGFDALTLLHDQMVIVCAAKTRVPLRVGRLF